MKVLLLLATIVAVSALVAVGVVGTLYMLDDDDSTEPVRTSPVQQRFSPPKPAGPTTNDVAECMVIAQSRGYNVSAMRMLLERTLADGTVTAGESQQLMDFCDDLIGR
jgi:hypothetical protein